jgi:hypothetical protein
MYRLEYIKVRGNPQLGDLELHFTEENEIAVELCTAIFVRN